MMGVFDKPPVICKDALTKEPGEYAVFELFIVSFNPGRELDEWSDLYTRGVGWKLHVFEYLIKAVAKTFSHGENVLMHRLVLHDLHAGFACRQRKRLTAVGEGYDHLFQRLHVFALAGKSR